VSAVDISWLVVCYGTPSHAIRLARKIKFEDSRVRVIVCCNAAGDMAAILNRAGSMDGFEARDMSHNPGYMGALRELGDELPPDGAVVLSNADLSLRRGTLRELRAALIRYPEAAVLAPRILTQGGEDQNPHLTEPPSVLKLWLLRWLHRWPAVADLMLVRRRGHSSTPNRVGVSPAEIFAGHGSCLVFTPEYRRSGGTFDYPCFLFGEEVWVGAEALRIRRPVLYVPRIQLAHSEHVSTGARRRRGAVAAAKYESLAYWSRRAAQLRSEWRARG
jgi:GT2 family glycosyltransferase